MNLQVVTELVRSIKTSPASLHRPTEISPSPFPRAMFSRFKCAFCLRVLRSVAFFFSLSHSLSFRFMKEFYCAHRVRRKTLPFF